MRKTDERMGMRVSVDPLRYPLAACVRGGIANGWEKRMNG
jgi:hypothetical protein